MTKSCGVKCGREKRSGPVIKKSRKIGGKFASHMFVLLFTSRKPNSDMVFVILGVVCRREM